MQRDACYGHGMARIRQVVAVALVAGVAAARADIYAYTDADGSVSLSNVPADARYTVLVPEGANAVLAPAAAASTAAAALRGRAGRSAYDPVIQQVSLRHGLDSALLHAVVSVESGYDPRAVSRAGAQGLMQLMPETARRYGVQDPFDPRQNLDGGARYLRDLLRLFHDDVSLALAAYNAGEAAVARHGNRIPPYGETQRYVPLVLQQYRRARTGP